MVSVGVIINKKYNIVYSMNSILMQDYDAIELLITINQSSGILVTDLFDCIDSHRGSNIVSIEINYSEETLSEIQHTRYICEKAQGDVICILLNDDAFYEINSLSNIVEFVKANPSDQLYFGKSVCFGTDNTFEYVYPNVDIVKLQRIGLRNSVCICGTKRVFVESINKSSSCLSELCSKVISNVSVTEAQNCFSEQGIIRHTNRDKEKALVYDDSNEILQNGKLNYSDSIYLLSLIKSVMQYGKRKKTLNLINQKIELLVGKSANGYWNNLGGGMTESSLTLVAYLQYIKDNMLCCFWSRKKRCLQLIEEIEQRSNSKIKVVLAVNEPVLWTTCYKSIYLSMQRNSRFIVDVVHIPFTHVNKSDESFEEEHNQYLNMNIGILRYSEYDIAKECPDIIIYSKPYNVIPPEWYVGMIEKVVKRIIYIPYIMIPGKTNQEYIKIFYQMPMNLVAWKYLSYNRMHTELMKKYSINHTNLLPIGHPKYDIIKELFSDEDMEVYNKILQTGSGRKIVMWNSHFDIDMNSEEGRGTFFTIGNDILDFFERNADTFYLVWRPHPMFFTALSHIFTEEEANIFWDKVNKSSHIYVDKYLNQMPAVLASDVLISDESSVVETYVITGKPVLLTVRNKVKVTDNDYYSTLYVVDNIDEIINNLHMIEEGRDTKYSDRNAYIKNNYYLPEQNEKVADRLINVIVNGIDSEEQIYNTWKGRV